jgi:hypothetical protein
MATEHTPTAGDTGSGSQSEPGDTGSGDTSGSDTSGSNGDGASGDTDEIAALRAQVSSLTAERDGLIKDRDKAARKRDASKSEFEDRLSAMEAELKTERDQRAADQKQLRRRETADELLELVHADHRTDKKTRRLLTAIEAEGIDFAAEDRKATVEAVEKILKKDHPEVFEPKRRTPNVPQVGGERGGSGSTQGGGERLI